MQVRPGLQRRAQVAQECTRTGPIHCTRLAAIRTVTPWAAGPHAGLPLTLALTALAPFAGRLTDRFGGKWVLPTGLVVYGAGIAEVAAVSSVHATSLTFAPVLLVVGLAWAQSSRRRPRWHCRPRRNPGSERRPAP
jgi:hypothetical protein